MRECRDCGSRSIETAFPPRRSLWPRCCDCLAEPAALVAWREVATERAAAFNTGNSRDIRQTDLILLLLGMERATP